MQDRSDRFRLVGWEAVAGSSEDVKSESRELGCGLAGEGAEFHIIRPCYPMAGQRERGQRLEEIFLMTERPSIEGSGDFPSPRLQRPEIRVGS